ncbi:hypothetical protein VTJ83DRAFT_6996 [Remersonia thermophila]|uniref:aldehyde dehydrogenase (NAD(+)) n=1 Tax=Remersonia thermophila TaxID=72144 RepID=A0ABR4D3Q8_9PEZI
MGGAQRGVYLKRLATLLRENKKDLARLDAIAMGMPVSTHHYAQTAAIHFDYYSEAWATVQGQASVDTPGFVTMTLRQPYGVAPLAVARIAELVVEAGFPPGVFNIISGHGVPSGRILSRHMDVRALSFTGSSRTGKLIQEEAARTSLKKVTLELGGKVPGHPAAHTQFSIQTNSGQDCMANSRIYVQKSIAPRFIEAFKTKFAAARAGDPLDRITNHGPQADEVQYRTVLRYIEEGKECRKLVLGGNGMFETTNGFFVEPTVFLDVPETARIAKEEVFGPVVLISTFETEAEAISKANDTEFSLYAAVCTKDVNRAMRVAKALESGYVAINCTSPRTGFDLPFGGYKSSG